MQDFLPTEALYSRRAFVSDSLKYRQCLLRIALWDYQGFEFSFYERSSPKSWFIGTELMCETARFHAACMCIVNGTIQK